MKHLDLHNKELAIKIIREAINKRECGQFETALQHESKLRMYRELKGEIDSEEYLKHVKGAPSRLFLKLHSVTHGLFEELGWHAGGGGSQECRNCGACEELFEYIFL